MNKTSLALVAVLFLSLGISGAKISPYDLIDDVYDQYNQLVSIITGLAGAATSEITSLGLDISTTGQNKYEEGRVNIISIRDQVRGVLQTLIDVAAASGVDITACTSGPEEQINTLPDIHLAAFQGCIDDLLAQANSILLQAVNNVNGVLDRAKALENDIIVCGGGLECLLQVSEIIGNSQVEYTTNINTEVQSVRDTEPELELQINACHDLHIPNYNNEMTAQINAAAQCMP